MGIKYDKQTENDEKTISFKEALGLVSTEKKDGLRKSGNNSKKEKK